MIRVVDLGFGGCRRRIWGFSDLLGWESDGVVRFVFFFKNENRMHPHPVHNFKKRKGGYLCNFMKDSYGIKKLYGVLEEGMGVEEEFVFTHQIGLFLDCWVNTIQNTLGKQKL